MFHEITIKIMKERGSIKGIKSKDGMCKRFV